MYLGLAHIRPYGFDLDSLDGLGGGGFTFACTAWWRVIYLLCLVVSRLKGVLVI